MIFIFNAGVYVYRVEGIIYDFSLCHVLKKRRQKKVHGMLVNWFVWRFKVQSRFVILNGLFLSLLKCLCIKMHVFVISFLSLVALNFFSGDKNLIFMHVFAITFSLSLCLLTCIPLCCVLQSFFFRLHLRGSWEKIVVSENLLKKLRIEIFLENSPKQISEALNHLESLI